MKNIVIVVFLGIFIIGCNNQNNRINSDNFTLEYSNDSIYINLGKKEVNNTDLMQYFYNRDTNYLALLNYNRRTIEIYNLDKRRLHKKVKIKEEGTDAFPGAFGYVIKNSDTIILISNWPRRIGIINGEGKILKTILCDKDENGTILFPGIPLWGQKGILNGNILYLAHEFNIPQYNGNLSSVEQKNSRIALSVNIDNGKIKLLPLNYPLKLVGKDIFNMTLSRDKGYNNCFVYLFTIMGDLFVTEDFSSFKEIPIKTNYQLKLPENMSKYQTDLSGFLKYQMSKDLPWRIIYDKYRECYYVLIRKRETDMDNNDAFRTNSDFPDCFIIILDKNFKHLGDVHFPKNTYSFNNLFITKEGVYISEDNVDNPTYSEDAMRFRLFKLKKIDDK
jgi:hypothetical protein